MAPAADNAAWTPVLHCSECASKYSLLLCFALGRAARCRAASSHNRDACSCTGEVDDPTTAGDATPTCEICGCEQPPRIVGYRSDAQLRRSRMRRTRMITIACAKPPHTP